MFLQPKGEKNTQEKKNSGKCHNNGIVMSFGNAEEGVLLHGTIQSVFHGGWTA